MKANTASHRSGIRLPGTTSDHVKVTLPALGGSGFVRLKVTQM